MSVDEVRALLDRINICQGGEEPHEMHVRYCVPLAEQKATVLAEVAG